MSRVASVREFDGIVASLSAVVGGLDVQLNRVLKGYPEYNPLPDEVWLDRDFLDEMFDSITDLYVVGAMGLASLVSGSSLPMTAYGVVVGMASLAIAVRYVYRKVRTGGRYAGVRRPYDDDY